MLVKIHRSDDAELFVDVTFGVEIVALVELSALQLFEKRQILRFRVRVAPVDDTDRDLFAIDALEVFLVVRGQADVGSDDEDLLLSVLDDLDECCTNPRCVEESAIKLLLMVIIWRVGVKRFGYPSVAPDRRSEAAVPEIPLNDYTISSSPTTCTFGEFEYTVWFSNCAVAGLKIKVPASVAFIEYLIHRTSPAS
jgi:hypothetical protein